MEVIAKGKYIRISPKKAREVADVIRGKNARVALEMVKAMPQASADVFKKVIASAMANAENNFNLDKDALTVSTVMVDGGPTLKRWQPRAKGAAFSIKKRTSHITLIVSGDVKTKIKKSEKTETEKIETESAKEAKLEVERPAYMEKQNVAPRADVKTKMFRRKTG